MRLFALSVCALGSWVMAEHPHWLYFTSQGAWVEHQQQVMSYPLLLDVPSQAVDLWWQSKAQDQRVTRIKSEDDAFLRPGALLELRAPVQQRRLEVLQVMDNALVARYLEGQKDTIIIPSSAWQQYQLVSSRGRQDQLQIESLAEPGTRKWAYLHPGLQAEVSYQLDLAASPLLSQGLWLTNHTEQLISAPGFSYQPGQQRSFQPRMMAMEAMDIRVASSPMEVQQGLQSAIEYHKNLDLPANSQQWLPMSQLPVEVKHGFTSHWHLGPQSATAAEWQLSLSSEAGLPRLPGQLVVNWFDKLYAQQSSFYQLTQAQQAVLAMGSHPEVLLSATVMEGQQWLLSLHNGLPLKVDWQVNMHSRANKQQQQAVLNLEVPTGTTEYIVSLVDGQIQYRPR